MRDARYAVYLAPAATSALWRFGSCVVGRDAVSGEAIVGYAPAGFDAASCARPPTSRAATAFMPR